MPMTRDQVKKLIEGALEKDLANSRSNGKVVTSILNVFKDDKEIKKLLKANKNITGAAPSFLAEQVVNFLNVDEKGINPNSGGIEARVKYEKEIIDALSKALIKIEAEDLPSLKIALQELFKAANPANNPDSLTKAKRGLNHRTVPTVPTVQILAVKGDVDEEEQKIPKATTQKPLEKTHIPPITPITPIPPIPKSDVSDDMNSVTSNDGSDSENNIVDIDSQKSKGLIEQLFGEAALNIISKGSKYFINDPNRAKSIGGYTIPGHPENERIFCSYSQEQKDSLNKELKPMTAVIYRNDGTPKYTLKLIFADRGSKSRYKIQALQHVLNAKINPFKRGWNTIMSSQLQEGNLVARKAYLPCLIEFLLAKNDPNYKPSIINKDLPIDVMLRAAVDAYTKFSEVKKGNISNPSISSLIYRKINQKSSTKEDDFIHRSLEDHVMHAVIKLEVLLGEKLNEKYLNTLFASGTKFSKNKEIDEEVRDQLEYKMKEFEDRDSTTTNEQRGNRHKSI